MSIIDTLRNIYGEKVKATVDKYNEIWIEIPSLLLREVLALLQRNGYDHLSTITGHDDGERIRLIYHLIKFGTKSTEMVNIVTYADRNNPVVPSMINEYPSALVYEREIFDLLGVKFEGHKGLKRLLLPEDVPEDFHPLRKDFKVQE